jgi:creatinine amidohydrolase
MRQGGKVAAGALLLGEQTSPETAALGGRQAVVFLPIGAVEAHGPHLPLATDCLIAEELARRAAAALAKAGRPALVAPTLSYARAEFAAALAGTISLQAEAFAVHAEAVLAALARAGLERICLCNGHIEPAHVEALRQLVARPPAGARPVLFDQTERRWRHRLKAEAQGIDGHAGAYETALVLATRPELVRRPLPEPVTANLGEAIRAGAKSFAEAGGADGYFGAPASATAELGERIYGLLVEMVLVVCQEAFGPAR